MRSSIILITHYHHQGFVLLLNRHFYSLAFLQDKLTSTCSTPDIMRASTYLAAAFAAVALAGVIPADTKRDALLDGAVALEAREVASPQGSGSNRNAQAYGKREVDN